MATQSPFTGTDDAPDALSLERLSLTNFRNYDKLVLAVSPRPVVLTGANGAGKTNILEAVSLLMPGSGLRRATYKDMARANAGPNWAVAARVASRMGRVDIGTGLQAQSSSSGTYERAGRTVRIDGENKGASGILAHYVDMVWITPAMDGVFTGATSDRRRLLDRLVVCFDPAFRVLSGRFERAMQSRNRLLTDGVHDHARLEGFELVMAETGAAIAAARVEAVGALKGVIEDRKAREPNSAFPWSYTVLEGALEQDIMRMPAVDVEDAYMRRLAQSRDQDRAAGRTLEGPHRTDLAITHGPKNMPARLCSTGEQKVLLAGLILAQAELIAKRHNGCGPIILLDEVAAHLDSDRRLALFNEILRLRAQAWMTGTDIEAFAPLRGAATIFSLDNGTISQA